jgi:hypothetical protein
MAVDASQYAFDDEHIANQMIRLIRKLRWMGLKGEAERVQLRLETGGLRPADSVLAAPRNTD